MALFGPKAFERASLPWQCARSPCRVCPALDTGLAAASAVLRHRRRLADGQVFPVAGGEQRGDAVARSESPPIRSAHDEERRGERVGFSRRLCHHGDQRGAVACGITRARIDDMRDTRAAVGAVHAMEPRTLAIVAGGGHRALAHRQDGQVSTARRFHANAPRAAARACAGHADLAADLDEIRLATGRAHDSGQFVHCVALGKGG